MRAIVDVGDRGGELVATVAVPGVPVHLPERPVRWAADRILVPADEDITEQEAKTLASAVDEGAATPAELDRYGTLLFDAAFGPDNWRELTTAAIGQGAPHLELAIRGPQSLRWEALHDGTNPVAAKGTGDHGQLSVAIVRLIPATIYRPQGTPHPLFPVTRIPRMLYAAGSRLTDPKVRPGAEFMGIMRHLERKGGWIQPRVLEQAAVPDLIRELERFKPDVLHVIGHGRRDPIEDRVRLELHPEPSGDPGDEFVTAGQLLEIFAAAGHLPAVVVLSACQTGSAASPDALPFAADLVGGGVPVVVAMAGDISDTACRVFARALTHAISHGTPIAKAVAIGRRAAFYKAPGPANTDWVLPVVFLAENLPPEESLVDTTSTENARKRCRLLDLDWEPVFCGRGEFLTAMDRLLDAEDPLNVLVAYTEDATRSYGGMRLLRELSARAVREGWLPVLLGPFDEAPPVTRQDFADELRDRLDDMRAYLGLPRREDRLAAAAASGPKALAQAIRDTFTELVADLPEDDPVRADPRPRVVLLCHRVDQWADVLPELFGPGPKMLGLHGLGAGEYPVPVVLTGADVSGLKQARTDWGSGARWAKFAPLGRFRMDDDNPEDILAYLWWLLNPEEGPVYAPKRDADRDELRDLLRYAMREVIYQETALFGLAKAAKSLFTSDTDSDILASYMKAAP